MDVGEFPWMTARLQRGDVVDFSRLEALPDEAAVDRQSYLAHRVKPQVAVPLLVGGIVVGGLVFSTVAAERARSDELIQQLHLLGEVFANALSRKQGELEAQRLRQDLTHIGRVSALGELAASLAHELNQPLTAILSNAQAAQRLLAVDAANLEEVREILKDIVTDDKRAGDGAAAVRVAVQDAGIGIDETVGDRMFQPLYTTKAGGLGMGLAIARTIVGGHGGALGAANNAHGGATFHFTLPTNSEQQP